MGGDGCKLHIGTEKTLSHIVIRLAMLLLCQHN